MKNSNRLANELFYCEHLFEHKDIIKEIRRDFCVLQKSGKGLDVYLKEYSADDERRNENRTYIVRDKESDNIV